VEANATAKKLLNPLDATVRDLFLMLEQSKAACAQTVMRTADDTAIGAIIVVQGPLETEEVLAAVNALTKAWADSNRNQPPEDN
jgi:hypothetical protein